MVMILILAGPWKRISMVDAIKEVTGIDFKKEMTVEEALELALNIKLK